MGYSLLRRDDKRGRRRIATADTRCLSRPTISLPFIAARNVVCRAGRWSLRQSEHAACQSRSRVPYPLGGFSNFYWSFNGDIALHNLLVRRFPCHFPAGRSAGKIFSLPMSRVSRRKAMITTSFSARFGVSGRIFPVFPARQGKRAAPLEAAFVDPRITPGTARQGRPSGGMTSQLCQRNCCGFLAAPCEITTLTRAGPRWFIASSRAPFKSFGSSTKKPLPPKASIIRS
jgi:hypothetical protein